ncbi:MAG: GNAT family N-acetyltransferase [Planctomycetota bacterium]|nr:GNAT family N-acetyltransferase [Planctomycetaceae bacterium]MDQ3331802.1 GNAT family N-acetyltransferase [Planctomycetota bacterium]
MIETPRLVLRPFRLTDRGALSALLSDPEVMRFSVSGPKPCHDIVDGLEEWVANHRPTNPERWAVTLQTSDECLGFCGFSFHPVAGEWVWELGYRLLPAIWGQGFATEAAAACRDWFFATTRHDKFVLMIDPANVASARVADKIGARYEFDADCYGMPVGIYAVRRLANFT